MADSKITCPSCGFKNNLPLTNDRCVSCGAKIDLSRANEAARRFRQDGFNVVWFGIALAVIGALTGGIVFGLPMVVGALDFEGQAGMMVAIPVWFVAGVLVGLISPGKTFIEPVVAVFLVATPTAYTLYLGQTVKTMPWWVYVLLCALGILFSLVGAYVGERLQLGPAPRASD